MTKQIPRTGPWNDGKKCYICGGTVVESAGNEIRSMVSLPFLGSSSLHKNIVSLAPCSFRWLTSPLPIYHAMSDNELFITYKLFFPRGKVLLMKSLDKTKSDYNDLIVIAFCFARLGHTVKVLNNVHYKDSLYKKVFGSLIGTRYYRKCPDLLVDDLFYEYESYEKPWRKQKIQRMLTNGIRQCSRIIINNNKGAVDRHIRKLIMARVNLNAPLEEVWLYEKGNIRLLYKKQQGG